MRGPAPAPNVIEYFPERPRLESPATAWFAVMATAFVVIVVGAIVGAFWGITGGALVLVYLWLERRLKKRRAAATLSVNDGRLTITNAGGWEILDVALDELENVRLDNKTVQHFQEDTLGGFPDVRAVHTRMGPKLATSRIEIVTAHRVVELTDHYTSNIDATDWLAKIRRFLRVNGWRPYDERDGSEV